MATNTMSIESAVIMKVKNVSKALVFNLSMARLLAREHFKE
jgi:hypothetical protein